MPDGRAFIEESQFVGLDGKVAEHVQAAAAKWRGETPQPDAPKRPHKSLDARLADAISDLRRFTEAWDRARADCATSAPLRSPAGREQVEYLYPSPFAHHTAAGPREPVSADHRMRAAAIQSAQKLADAIRALMVWDWDRVAWHPQGLAYTTQRTIGGRRVTLVMCDSQGAVCWRLPDDLATPLPDSVAEGVSQLRGMYADLERMSWESQDDIDRDVLGESLTAVEAAVSALRHEGVWARPEPAKPPILCSRRGCMKEVAGGTVCPSCKSKEYRQRKKAS
jgi:hypothetical protein